MRLNLIVSLLFGEGQYLSCVSLDEGYSIIGFRRAMPAAPAVIPACITGDQLL